MTATSRTVPDAADLQPLFEPAVVAELLQNVLPRRGTKEVAVRDVRVERCWPMRGAAFAFEWSFNVSRGRRDAVFGIVPANGPAADEQRREATISRGRLRGLYRYLPERNLLLHSADADPLMPHLTVCLDGRKMAARLRSIWEDGHDARAPVPRSLKCKLLGYRARRRAAIAYGARQARNDAPRLLGKTFRDDRAERLARIHLELNEELQAHSDGRVRAPTAVGVLPELHMALFAWAARKKGNGETLVTRTLAGVDVLTALHRSAAADMPAFTIEDECEIVLRWHAALERVDPPSAAATQSLVERLLALADALEPPPVCTIHRDFYERQFIVGSRTITLLDLDTLARGPACVDLGNLLAHVRLTALADDGTPTDLDELSGAVLGRYERHMGPVDRQTLGFFHATALFRVGAVHALRTATRRHTAPLWTHAYHVLQMIKNDRALHCRTIGSGTPRSQPRRVATRESA